MQCMDTICGKHCVLLKLILQALCTLLVEKRLKISCCVNAFLFNLICDEQISQRF